MTSSQNRILASADSRDDLLSPIALKLGSEVKAINPLEVFGTDTTKGKTYGNYYYLVGRGGPKPDYISGPSSGCKLYVPRPTYSESVTIEPQIMTVSGSVKHTSKRYKATAYKACKGRNEIFSRTFYIPLQSSQGELELVCVVSPVMADDGCPNAERRDAQLNIGEIRSLMQEDFVITPES